jgi:hypothetical protein
MKYKSYIIVFSILILVNLVFASTINLESSKYTEGPFYKTFGSFSTGSQIEWVILVSNDNPNLIKDTYLTWNNSNVGCNVLERLSNGVRYKCILTITPFMKGFTDVFVVTKDLSNSEDNLLLGNYEFRGQEFPVLGYNPFVPRVNTCHKETVCSKYKKTCEYTQTCRRYSKDGSCMTWRKVKTCTLTDECIKYRTVRVCN